ncbi:MAG TPA: hypothetical protein VL463_18495 [Kofleriaceae bacterium]|nr:hypothetical protein [Kofleriaceae bacterium]
MRSTLFLVSALTLAASACGFATDDEITSDDVTAPDGDKADAELSVRAADTTLWAQSYLARRGDTFYLHARTSRNLDGDGTGYVFDDPYGAYTKLSARVFEVAYGASELGPLSDGVNLFVGFSVTGHPSLTARVVVRPRLVDIAGSSKLYFTAEITPVAVDGTTVFRAKGTSTAAMTAVSSSAGAATLVDATHFTVDLSRADLAAIAGTSTTFEVTATIAGAKVARHGHVALAVKKLGLTNGDAYDKWPAPTCTSSVKACLSALPGDALDLSSCGDAITVDACWGQVGAIVDGPSITAAMNGADTRLAGMSADAASLAGADQATAFTTALRQRVQDAVNAKSNRWYLSVATRDAQLAAAVDGTFDRAYARPLELVPAHAPIPGDAQRAREVAADALLAYLAQQDYVSSEFGRSYDQLTKEFRTQHVTSVGEFRVPPDDIFTDPSLPHQAIYIGQWLGTHVEVTIDTTTGAATHVLVELD